MKRLSFILTLVLVSFFLEIRTTTALFYTPPDSCLKIVQEWRDTSGIIHGTGGIENPDSVRVDSCFGSPTFGEQYVSNESYRVYFNYNIIPRNYLAPYDTLIEYSISDILPIYTTAIQEFQKLESDYGAIIFRELLPNQPDTTPEYKRYLEVRFSGMLPIQIVNDRLDSSSCVAWCGPTKFVGYATEVRENESLKEITIAVENDFLKIINNSGIEISNVSLFDLQGLLIRTYENRDAIYISNLRSGIYFAKINGKFYKFSII